ncbi:glycoside hydrolase family 3 N-terminal domain-containing protein [Mycolicibacterium frederiksbergense]|uniref:beta-N-acetylhexosaminidase n=1 Tax=Mycolicibacterium frederiksbergense TaxID=117567 RepID=A0A6H0S630_9MYCO|nr:glycoside hydrolase family 3 N-terminal domain-containing protein [Mycolicibacterium frederiksbergense]MDO0973575.1 glycoside hydrolase family 3 N-terminal domain-containing protein [Mycolicibacterium frederiksbergense]QIV81795.1 glycoside hydrolase family 3 protein [Mycolicibacterium frederiksbergense]
MSMSRALGALTALSGLLLACSPAEPQEAAAPPAPVSSGPVVPTNASFDQPLPAAPAPGSCDIATMSTRDKLAQLLMVGVSDAADARAVVADQHVGGIMIGSWTDKSMLGAPLADIAANAGPLSLAVSVDEEGGRVSRLAGVIGSQPSARELAQTKTPDEVYGIALERGRAMRGLGITVDFAPVVDLTQQSAAIGDRSFGDDPETVTEYAGAYARGLRDAGVLPVLKHFPGHGRAAGDSHTGAVSTPPLADLQNDDLVPYRTLTKQPPVAVMVGHMQVPGLTGGEQASLSPAAYNLLRTEFGFGGLVYTDDLSSMAAINQQYGVAAAVLKSLQAGADVALWITTAEVPAVLDRLEQAVAAGELSPGAVDASVQRVAAAKGPNPNCGR